MLARASLNGDTAARAAMEDFCRRYQTPLREFARYRGVPEADREDVVQEFLAHLAHESMLHRADRERGRFRAFLLGAFRRHLGRYWRMAQTQKRGGDARVLSLEETDETDTVGPASSDETATFDRLWAVAVMERAIQVLARECADAKRDAEFAVLVRFLPGGEAPPSYQEAAAELGVPVTHFQTLLHRVRQRLREAIRREILPTVSAPHEVEEEVSYLGQVLMQRGS